MRTIVLIITIIFIGVSSCKKRTDGTMTVIKVCEGTYLRLNNKDYKICNENKLEKYGNGAIVKARFVRDDGCVSDRAFCMVLHDYETEMGNFRVTKIKLNK